MSEKHIACCDRCGREAPMERTSFGSYLEPAKWEYVSLVNKLFCPFCVGPLKSIIKDFINYV